MPKTIAWDVLVPKMSGLVEIDTVFYTEDCDAEYVRRSLVEHDGYPSNIVVKKA